MNHQAQSSIEISEPIIEDQRPVDPIFRAQPMEENSKFLINQIPFEEDKDKELMASNYPPMQEDMKASILNKSTIEQCNFVTRLDTIDSSYRENMVKLMEFGFVNFDFCLNQLNKHSNNFEKTIDQILNCDKK